MATAATELREAPDVGRFTPELRVLGDRYRAADGERQRLRWRIADLVAAQEKRYGMLARAAEVVGVPPRELRSWVSVARRVPPRVRRPDRLRWNHHEAVARLAPEEQDGWLDRAEREGLTVRELRAAVHGRGDSLDEFPEVPLPECPPHSWRCEACGVAR